MKAVNVDDVLEILHKYGKYVFVTDEKKYSTMVDEIANLKALKLESFINKSCVSSGVCEHDKNNVLDKIRAEIDRQEKWLLQAGYTAYNVDIAFDAIKAVLAESEVEK